MKQLLRKLNFLSSILVKLEAKKRPISVKRNRLNLTDRDVIILSYPRSGNTWMRYMIADIILQAHGFQTDSDLPIDFDRVIPSIYKHEIATHIDERIQLPYRIIKSHEFIDAENRKFIYTFRRPTDSLCSFYHYLRNHPHNPDKQELALNLSIEEFCSQEVDEWIKHLEKALSLHSIKENHKNICWVCYEKLHEYPQAALKSVIRFLELDESQIEIDKAIENHTKENQIKVFKKKNQADLNRNIRKGRVGTSIREISPETLRMIESKTQALYKEAYALCGR